MGDIEQMFVNLSMKSWDFAEVLCKALQLTIQCNIFGINFVDFIAQNDVLCIKIITILTKSSRYSLSYWKIDWILAI